MEPFADAAWYAENFGPVPEALDAAQLDRLLARASRTLRAEAAARHVDLDGRIEAGDLDADLVADVACEMATEAASTLDYVGVAQFSQTGGPYTESHSFRDTAGRLYVGKDARRKLGLSGQRAFAVDTSAGVTVR